MQFQKKSTLKFIRSQVFEKVKMVLTVKFSIQKLQLLKNKNKQIAALLPY